MASSISIPSIRHPDHLFQLPDWDKWRYIWGGGDDFVRRYLQKFSKRETEDDYQKRLQITPIPGFAKSAIVDIKNAVFNRMGDIIRKGGTQTYQSAVAGLKGGVDRRGASMNNFIGTEVLPELLTMGKVGVFVDNLPPKGPTLADVKNAAPYLYMYRVEDILSWSCSSPENPSDFQSILLRDWCLDYETTMFGVDLPKSSFDRYRLLWIGDDGFVYYQFFDAAGNTTSPYGVEAPPAPVRLELTKIPFVLFDIGDSLLRDISNHQIALLNLCSSDVAYALKANYPFYTEQQDTRAIGSHLKSDVMEDGTASTGGQGANIKNVEVGAIDGRIYDINADRPGFIHPSSEPLKASMALQAKLEDDIRKLVNLAVVALGNSRASAEARNIDNQGLESGLAFIGMVLENGERKIADHWTSYESSKQTVIVKYPERYNLKSAGERLDEADKLTKLMFSIPGQTVKKELAKDAVASLLAGRITPEKLDEIFKEIDTASYSTSSPEVIKLAKEQGLASDVTLSNALGFNGEDEIEQAKKDHAERIARIQEAQGGAGMAKPGARGVQDMAMDSDEAEDEREDATDTTTSDSTEKPVRGEGKDVE